MKKIVFFTSIFLFIIAIIPSGAFAGEILTWQDCLREAAKNHPDLISAQETINQSKAAKDISSSGLFPQVTADLSAASAKTSGAVRADTYAYGASGTQLIFDGVKTINDVKSASETIKSSQQGFKFTSAAVRQRLRTAFVNLLKAQELKRITEEIYKIRRSNLELITLRYESGLEHKGALLTAEANLSEAGFEITQAARDDQVAQRQLTKEMGRAVMAPIGAKGDFEVAVSVKEKPDLEGLAKTNPSLQQIIAQRNAAEFNLKSTYGNFSPVISGSAGANKTDSSWPPKTDKWNASVSVSMPVFEGGLRFAQVSQAKAQLKQLEADERSKRDSIVLALEQAWASLEDAIDNVGVQKKFLSATEERANIAEAQYSLGIMTFDNWTIIEDNLVSAKKAFLNAQANALTAEANWIQAKGDTLENG